VVRFRSAPADATKPARNLRPRSPTGTRPGGYAAWVAHADGRSIDDRGTDEAELAGDQREVAFTDELVILPDQTRDDTDAGWGERSSGNDDRLLAERPPHWD